MALVKMAHNVSEFGDIAGGGGGTKGARADGSVRVTAQQRLVVAVFLLDGRHWEPLRPTSELSM